MWISQENSPLSVYQYFGTYDQWSYRSDPRSATKRNKQIYDTMKRKQHAKIMKNMEMEAILSVNTTTTTSSSATNAANTDIVDNSATFWLQGLIQQHGSELVQELLEGAGQVDYK